MRLALAVAALALASAPLGAQLPPTVIENDSIVSRVLGETRPVRVALPKDYDRGGGPYHVVVTLDGNASVEYTIGIVETLYQSGLPRVLVVGVPSTHRSRDLSHTISEDTPSGGGADRFLQFIARELMPWVAERYRITEFHVLAGHSLGGLFGVYALATMPHLFDAYIAISPSVFLNRDSVFVEVDRFLDGAARGTLFVAMGHEPGEEGEGILRLRDVLARRAPEPLSWTFRAYPEESHSSVPVPATMDGLRYVFRGYLLPDSVRHAGLPAIVAHYGRQRGVYGIDVPVPQRVLVDFGFDHLVRGDTTTALAVFSYYAEIYPSMTLPLAALADIHAARGEPCRALTYVERILEVSPNSLDAQRKREALDVTSCAARSRRDRGRSE